MESFDVSLLRRSIGQKRTHQSIRPLYSHREWVTDLDIVNELGGHTGCVNALSWSTGGRLLASGSDDTYLNIWEHNPSDVARPFTLRTSVATGHHANIFSVKFMPHSGDRTVVTCAGDSEVRVFDVEYGGADRGDTTGATSTRSRRFNDFFRNAKWLTEANTNARVYRSHADRAKRIVTESSPHLFLSCSEDGEVRQWDLRQPSSAYPAPRGSRRLGRFRAANTADDTSGDVPPPLISYKKYDIDLNSISCSSSQPHYIALGGAHLHCFLHDRRMLGRDISDERGQPGSQRPVADTQADDTMREATKCVRRFAPGNKRKARPHNTGHITACKLSDARPNELISSWSGDHIYSFDIVKSPDARDAEDRSETVQHERRLRNRAEKKRKRAVQLGASSSSLGEQLGDGNFFRRVANETQEDGHTALRVRHGHGDSEEISTGQGSEAAILMAHDTLLTEAQQQAQRVAESLVKLRKTLFDFSAVINETETASMENSPELTPFTSHFTNVLGQACNLLPEMEDIMRRWSYPINPSREDVEFQNTLRRNRQSVWRLVQAAGVISRVLGGKLRTLSAATDPRLDQFDMIRPAPREKISEKSRFYYDFLKAIFLWLDRGDIGVLEGFKKPINSQGLPAARFLIDDSDDVESMTEKLRASLHASADEDKPVLDLDSNRFLHNENRSVFPSQKQCVNAFIRALDSIELKMHQGMSGSLDETSGAQKRVMDKGAAARFWGVKVARSLLMDAAQGVDFAFVQQAFGGSRLHVVPPPESSSEDEELVETTLGLLEAEAAVEHSMSASDSDSHSQAVTAPEHPDTESESAERQNLTAFIEQGQEIDEREQSILLEDVDEQEADADDDDNEHDGSDDEDVESSDDGEPVYRRHARVAYGRSRTRTSVNLDVPYSSHTRTYKGHCNTRTVKDVNYYGLDDEYIVSGSDDGHFFIWDRKTSQIVNILEGDGEVVNVVQGHPYEPMIACSGIDSTVKIFGPGGKSRERARAARGIDIANPGGSVHSSLRGTGRSRQATTTNNDEQDERQSGDNPMTDFDDIDDEPVGENGLRSRKALGRHYEITSQNDAERQRGVDDTYVTEGMLARFAAALQRGELEGIAGQGFGGTGGTIVVDQDNCSVM